MTSQRVQRGKRMSAHAGRPAGRIPYGYKRIWNPASGAWERDVPNVLDGAGDAVEDSPAYIVREIFERIAAGDSITLIRNDLNERGIKTQHGYPWDNFKVRYVAMSPTYIGQRVHQSDDPNGRTKAVLDGVVVGWPPLVDNETFWAVQRILTDPARRTTRLGARTGVHLLAALARCGECGEKLVRRKAPADHKRTKFRWNYACRGRGCVGIDMEALDSYVEEVVVRWLSDPDVAAELTRDDNSAAARQASGEAEQARTELQQLYADCSAGLVSATIATLEEKRLLATIEEAEHRVQAALLPPVLVGTLGPQARTGWNALDVAAKKLIIRTIADIQVRRVGRGRRVPLPERVEWTWLLGKSAGSAGPRLDVLAAPDPSGGDGADGLGESLGP
jgi:hypothetical protein